MNNTMSNKTSPTSNYRASDPLRRGWREATGCINGRIDAPGADLDGNRPGHPKRPGVIKERVSGMGYFCSSRATAGASMRWKSGNVPTSGRA